MKRLKITTGLLVIVFAVLAVISCKDNKKEHDHKDDETEQTTKIDVDEQHLAYACPMKCEGDKTYENVGSCPVCGMDLKEMKRNSN